MKRLLVFILILIGNFTISTSAFAIEKEDIENQVRDVLKEITADVFLIIEGEPIKSKNTNGTIKYSETDLENMGAYSLAGVLRGTPGIDIKSYGGENTVSSIYVRGLKDFNSQININNVPATRDNYGGYSLSQIPFSTITSIEVTTGIKSVLKGSDGLGSVVNIYTDKEAGNYGDISTSLGSENKFEIQTDFAQSIGDIYFGGNLAKLSSNGHDLKPGNSDPDDDAYNSTSIYLFSKYSPEEIGNFSLEYTRNNPKTDYDSPNDGKQELLNTIKSFSYSSPLIVDIFQIDTWASTNEYNLFHNETEDWTFNGTSTHLGVIGSIFSESNVFSVGYSQENTEMDYRAYNSDTFQFDYIKDSKLMVSKAYLKNQYFYDDIFEVEALVKSHKSDVYEDAITYGFIPTLYLKDTTISLGVATGYAVAGISSLANTKERENLKAEKSLGYEFSLERVLGKNEVVKLTLFNTIYSDKIVAPAPDYLNINLEPNYIYQGLEIYYDLDISNRNSIHLDYTFLNVTAGDGSDVLGVAENKMNLVMSQASEREKVVTNQMIHYVGNRYDFGGVLLPSYATVDLGLIYNVQKGTKIKLNVYNLFKANTTETSGYSNGNFPKYNIGFSQSLW